MQVLDVKEVGKWDGGDRHNFAFYVKKEVSDEAIKEAHGVHCSITPRTIVIFDDLQEVADNSRAKLRRRAWEKLSPQERLAIGFEEPPECAG